MSSGEAGGPRLITLDSLGVQELHNLQNQVDSELKFFVTSLQELRNVQEKFRDTGDSVACLNSQPNEVLVPLTTSMFVRGNTDIIESVMVDIGTGYYTEMSKAKAVDFFERKEAYLEKQIQKVQEVVIEKQKAKSLIVDTLQNKINQQSQQGKTAAA